MTTDFLIQLAQNLRGSPYDMKIESFTGGPEESYLCELHTKDGHFWGAGESATSFVNAYTKAEKQLRERQEAAAREADYQQTINDFIQGARLP